MPLDWLHWGKDDGVRKRRRRMSKRRGIKWKLADAALLAPCHAVQWVRWTIDWIFKMFPPLQWCISICIYPFQESTPRGTRLIRSTWSTPVARKPGSTRFTRHGHLSQKSRIRSWCQHQEVSEVAPDSGWRSWVSARCFKLEMAT